MFTELLQMTNFNCLVVTKKKLISLFGIYGSFSLTLFEWKKIEVLFKKSKKMERKRKHGHFFAFSI